MTRKSITTNGPVVACDVCGRTLLRGEHPEVFIHGGTRRSVCDLCTQRAAHEGWIREGLDDATVRSGDGAGRSRSLFARLRQRRADAARAAAAGAPATEDAQPVAVAAPEPPLPEPVHHEQRSVHAVPTNADLKMARALEIFNGSAHPRTVAGVARSLGAPIVAVRPSATEGSVVTIAVAWELSWYRYEVDLADEAAGPRVVGQGTELAELDATDQVPNAAADERGVLELAVAHA
ncbi:MAG TPA: hypothetical protein VN751_11995 [Solirubrobacteraceae bacterium]|nr:hypothetical protein [Solirubrobacteraceae bacterium]